MVKNERPDQWEQGIAFTSNEKKGTSVCFRGNDFTADKILRPEVTKLLLNENAAYTEDESVACAKVETTDGKERLYIKRSTHGFDKGQLYDPYGVYQKSGDLSKETHITGRMKYEYREVTKKAFSAYVDYLRTRNGTYLKSAENQVSNG